MNKKSLGFKLVWIIRVGLLALLALMRFEP